MMLLAKARAHLDQQRFVICFGIKPQRKNIQSHQRDNVVAVGRKAAFKKSW